MRSTMVSSNEEGYTRIGDAEGDRSGRYSAFERKLPAWLPSNRNLYWLLLTGIAAWFLFIHTPPYLVVNHKLGDVLVLFHLVGVVGVYLACIFNTLVTPSRNKPLHVWVGRVGLVLGLWGFGWGAWLSWGRPGVPLSFSIPITIGGVMQVISEVVGYNAIRKYKAVRAEIESLPPETAPGKVASLKEKQKTYLMTHIGCMVGLFVMACSIPAMIRLTDFGGLPALLLGLGALSVINHFYNESFLTGIQSKTATCGPIQTAQELSPVVHGGRQ